jgi:hypothetical protein
MRERGEGGQRRNRVRKRGRAITLAKSFPKSRNRLNLSASSARRFGRGGFGFETLRAALRHGTPRSPTFRTYNLLRICLGQATRNRRPVLFDCAHNERNEINIYSLTVSGMLL